MTTPGGDKKYLIGPGTQNGTIPLAVEKHGSEITVQLQVCYSLNPKSGLFIGFWQRMG